MPAFNPKLGELLYAELKQLGVRVLLGEKLVKMPTATNATAPEQPTLRTYLTEKGTQIEADIHFICFGLQLNTQYLNLGSILDERKQVKVSSYLQVQGYENIFAIGDIVNTGEAKLITTADANAATVIVPLGTTGGAVQLPLGKNGIVLGAWAASLIKGKSLRATQRWKALGATPDNNALEERTRT
jgi:pyruvate/2-oxoglutarate dehydrogenase complex dihydrolipoamide dehydrogenase (E3) component